VSVCFYELFANIYMTRHDMKINNENVRFSSLVFLPAATEVTVFFTFYILQGSVETRLGCDGIFSDHLLAYLQATAEYIRNRILKVD